MFGETTLFRNTKARPFIQLIEETAARYAGKPVSEVLGMLLNRSGYEEMLRTEGNQDRLDNLAELKQSIYEYEAACGERCIFGGLSFPCRAFFQQRYIEVVQRR